MPHIKDRIGNRGSLQSGCGKQQQPKLEMLHAIFDVMALKNLAGLKVLHLPLVLNSGRKETQAYRKTAIAAHSI